jgi:hypothetical protein
MEGHAMVRTGGIRIGTVAVAAMVASCGTPAPHSTASPTPHSTTPPRPSAAAGPCASVMATTPIAQVPAACAALWAPYGVTKVPPANLTDATPSTPQVVNETQGAVSDAQLAQWILASNRDSLWYRWAEANDQASVMPRLGVVALDPPVELQAMAAHEPISQPDCALFPNKVAVFPITADDRRFFVAHAQTVSDSYVFVGAYPGPCTVTATNSSGQTITLASYPTAGTTFFASHLVADPLLGPLLYYDGSGSCSESGAPPQWCQP